MMIILIEFLNYKEEKIILELNFFFFGQYQQRQTKCWKKITLVFKIQFCVSITDSLSSLSIFFLFSFINSDHESFILVYWQFHSSQVFFFIQMVKKRFFFCIFFWIQNSNRDYYDPNSMYIESHFTHTRIISVTFNSREKKEKNFVFFFN